jgi:hypothetical protein
MTKEEIIKLKRDNSEFGRNARSKNVARMVAAKTGYRLDTVARILNGTNPASKPHHFLWLAMAEELIKSPAELEDDGN